MTVDIKLTLRLPLSVHSAVTKAAEKADRSINAEIVERLNQSLGGVFLHEKRAEKDVLKRIADLEVRLAKLEQKRGTK